MNPPLSRSSLALSRVALLEGLSQDCLQQLAETCHWHTVEPGQVVLSRQDQRSDVYFLASGKVRVTTYGSNGRQVTFRDLIAGDYFGELSAIDGQHRSVDIVTLEPSVLASLDSAAFMQLLCAESRVARRVLQRLATMVRQLSERVVDLSTLGVQNRLHGELLRLARLAGIADNQALIDPAPHHAELAGFISTNREQVTRELNALQKQGILGKEGRALRVLDVARLEAMVNDVRG